MNVTKVKTTRNCAMFDKLWLKETVFYITHPYRRGSSTVDLSDIFHGTEHCLLGTIRGYWFDYGNKTLFQEVK